MIPVSIGLPVYNGENYLGQSIESILSQTFTDFELIIRDNASSDRTEEICRGYAARDSRITYIRASKNNGAAYNYNRLVSLSKGKYFKWASHDDILAPAHLEECHRFLEKNPDVGLCYPRTVIIDKEGIQKKLYHDGMDLMDRDPVVRLQKYWHRQAGECNAVFGLIRMNLLHQTGLIGAFNGSDQVLLGHLALLGRIKELPDRLFMRRDHELTSLRANPSARGVAAWFHPKIKGRIRPESRRTLEYLKILIIPDSHLRLRTRIGALKLWIGRVWQKKSILKGEILP